MHLGNCVNQSHVNSRLTVFFKGFYCAVSSYNTQRVYSCSIHQSKMCLQLSSRVYGLYYNVKKNRSSEKKCYTMGKNTASGGWGGGLKKNVFGTFMNVF